MVLLNVDSCSRADCEAFRVRDLLEAVIERPEAPDLLNKHPKPAMFIFKLNICWPTNMPISAEYETDQLHRSVRDVWQKGQPTTHGGTKRPYVCRRPPSEVQLCLGTSEYCSTDYVIFFERTRVWIKSIHIATISQRNSSEAGGVITIVDENVIGLDICLKSSIRTAVGRVMNYGDSPVCTKPFSWSPASASSTVRATTFISEPSSLFRLHTSRRLWSRYSNTNEEGLSISSII